MSLGIPLVNDEEFTEIDLAVDGADEIDPQLRMIKGGGGALFREKILLQSSRRRLILADESKHVQVLGKFGLPIEISPFGRSSIIATLESLGYLGKLRKHPHGGFLSPITEIIFTIFILQMYILIPRKTC